MNFSIFAGKLNKPQFYMTRYLILLVCFFFSLNVFSQKLVSRFDDRHINQQAAGAMVQYGINYYDLPEGYGYRPLLLARYQRFPLIKTARNVGLAIDIGPQIGMAYTDKFNFELGLFIYLNLGIALTDWDMISLIAGVGPHYISVETERQAKGFIFSDNFLLAYRRKFLLSREPYELSVYSGLRHISNASIKQPNGGIDNIIIGLGFAKLF
jgi:hypothetical protein